MSESRRDLLLLTVGCAVLFGLRLGARDLWNPNEPIYGQAVVEMAARADWLVPHVNGLVFPEKPILYFWLALLASKLLGGVSEAALRVPDALAAIATVLGTYVLARPYAGRVRALTSAIVAAGLFGIFWNARFVQMDILVTATTVWILAALTRVVDHGARPLAGYLAAGAVAGLGFVAKGPVAWVSPGLVFAVYLVATRRWREMVRWQVLAGAAMCLCVAAPWYVLLLRRGQTDVVVEVLFRQNFQRFVNPWDHQAPWWYYLETLWVDMAPWGFFMPLAFRLPRRDEGERRLALLSWVWTVSIVAFFSVSKSKRSPYVLPIAPAVAFLAAEVLVAYIAGRLEGWRKAWTFGIATALGALFFAGGVAGIVEGLAHAEKPAAASVAVLGGVAAAGGLVVLADALRRGRRALVPVSLAAATVAIYLAAAGVTLPALDAYKSARPFCERVAKLAGPEDEVASYAFWNWRAEYRYYLARPITNLAGHEPLRAAWTGPKRVVLLVEADRLGDARQVLGDVVPAIEGHVGSGTVYVFTNR